MWLACWRVALRADVLSRLSNLNIVQVVVSVLIRVTVLFPFKQPHTVLLRFRLQRGFPRAHLTVGIIFNHSSYCSLRLSCRHRQHPQQLRLVTAAHRNAFLIPHLIRHPNSSQTFSPNLWRVL